MQGIRIKLPKSSFTVLADELKQESTFFLLFDFFEQILGYLDIPARYCMKSTSKFFYCFLAKDSSLWSCIDFNQYSDAISNYQRTRILSQFRNIRSLYLPSVVTSSQLNRYMSLVTRTLQKLDVKNISIEFDKAFHMSSMPCLEEINMEGIKKTVTESDMRCLCVACPNVTKINLNYGHRVKAEAVQELINSWPQLQSLKVIEADNIDNRLFEWLVKKNSGLKCLELGGKPTEFNNKITLEGFELLTSVGKFSLEELRVDYCAKIGDRTIERVSECYGDTLFRLDIRRNFFEKVAKISDIAIRYLGNCQNLRYLTIQYTRKFNEEFAVFMAESLPSLCYLDLADCPIPTTLEPLVEGCPLLEEVCLSGDSWVSPEALQGLSLHPRIQVFHLGHFDHSDADCNRVINKSDYPPKGLYVTSVFENGGFPDLKILFLEEACDLSYWLDIRLRSIRPKLTINYTRHQELIKMKI